jgi:hypothetical protein
MTVLPRRGSTVEDPVELGSAAVVDQQHGDAFVGSVKSPHEAYELLVGLVGGNEDDHAALAVVGSAM